MNGPQTAAPGPAPSPAPPAPLLLPMFPGLPGFTAFSERLTRLGFRHAAEPLLRAPRPAPPPHALQGAASRPAFRVLDGLWLTGRGGNWLRVDAASINECRSRWEGSGDPRATEIRSLLNWLRRQIRDDVMRLRRVVLYQLSCLLADRPGGPTREAAEALGVHPTESAALAAAVAAGFPASGPVRQAGEEITDALRGGRLYRAAELAAALPESPADPELAAVLDDLMRRTDEVESLAAVAARRQASGQLGPAAEAWLGASRLAVDDPRVRAGLLGVAVLIADAEDGTTESDGDAGSAGAPDGPDGPGAPDGPDGPDGSGSTAGAGGRSVSARLDGDAVTLQWQPVVAPGRRRSPTRYRVFRFPSGAPEEAVGIEVADPPETARTALTAVDPGIPVGTEVRYVVVPLYGNRVARLPSASGPVLSAPEVEDLRWKAVPDGVRLSWRAHPRAVGTRVRRGAEAPVPGGSDGMVDQPLPAGDHWYRVSSEYRSGSGESLWTPGRTIQARAEEWPSQVAELAVAAVHADGRVELAWTPPARGVGQLVRWRWWPAAPGEDVTPLLAELFPPPGAAQDLDGPQDTAAPGGGPADEPPSGRRQLTLSPRRGASTRVTAVSVLDGRAVAGPSVLIEAPDAVADLVVRRRHRGWAHIDFRWPEPAVLVLVRWEQDGRVRERRVARSRMDANGVDIPLTGREAVVTVGAVSRPDVTVIGVEPARFAVPAVPPLPPAAPPAAAVEDTPEEPPPAPEAVKVTWWRRLWPWRRRG
ncbi:hypothetical protein [Streptomyces polygonati]|uniref:hypothetical protein n=1 Tax=Streptomyces polygonati TaxID=1617087 RepID=UPI0036DCA0E3